MFALLAGVWQCRGVILPSVWSRMGIMTLGWLGAVPLVGRLDRVAGFRESTYLRGERALLLVFDTATARVCRLGENVCPRNFFRRLLIGIISEGLSKRAGFGQITVEHTLLDRLLNTRGFCWLAA